MTDSGIIMKRTTTTEAEYGQNNRNRFGNYELGGGGHGGRGARCNHQRRGSANDALGGRFHQGWESARRAGGEAAGGDKPRENYLLEQAVYGPPARGSVCGKEDGAG